MYDAVIQEQSVLPNGVRLASILAGSLVRNRQAEESLYPVPTLQLSCKRRADTDPKLGSPSMRGSSCDGP